MIKSSLFSQQCGLSIGDSISSFKLPKNHPKSPLYFLTGDVTAYGRKDLKMTNSGYQILKKNILSPKNHSSSLYSETLSPRQAIAKHFGTKNKQINPNDIFLTHGANMALYNLLLTITNPGENILVPEPSYPFFHKNGPVFAFYFFTPLYKYIKNRVSKFKSVLTPSFLKKIGKST